MESGNTGPTWTELLGSNHWDGLLHPLDLGLRRLILRCGDLCQATYDAFISDPSSAYCGSSRYGKRDFFRKVSLHDLAPDLEVACFLYATAELHHHIPPGFLLRSISREAWSRESNWIGYVAVSSDAAARARGRREIYVAWRGTIRNLEWIDVLHPNLEPVQPLIPEVLSDDHNHHHHPKVMKGWHTIYTSSDPRSPFNKRSARDQLTTKIKELVDLYKDEELSIITVGHSLGACLAILSAFDIAENGLSKVEDRPEFPVCAVVFGSPKVGNKAFNERLRNLPCLRVLHVRNEIDVIPHYPVSMLGYEHTGLELMVDTRRSPYLKDSKHPGDWHNLQAMLHMVAGWNGAEAAFMLAVRRSIGLVNKSCGYLKEECLVPESWWVEKNKGMVTGEDGEWHLEPPFEDDVPVPEFDD